MKVPTRLCAYHIGSDVIPEVIENLKAHGEIVWGENRDISPELVELIMKDCLQAESRVYPENSAERSRIWMSLCPQQFQCAESEKVWPFTGGKAS